MHATLLRFFLTDGDPKGLRTIEISNMTILASIFPRTQLDKFSKRVFSQKPAVYLLLGSDISDPDQPVLYVGEGDPVLPRLKDHSANKDFWTEAIVFSSKDEYLTKTQIKYLEAELYRLSKDAFRVKLDNAQVPTKPNISEVEEAEIVQFLEGIKLILLSLGIQILEPRILAAVEGTQKIFEYKVRNAVGKMVIIDNDYVILKGSSAVKQHRQSCPNAFRQFRDKLRDNGILVDNGDGVFTFTQNVKFNSPSYAAAVVAGGSENGQKQWKYNNKSLKEIETEEANALDPN